MSWLTALCETWFPALYLLVDVMLFLTLEIWAKRGCALGQQDSSSSCLPPPPPFIIIFFICLYCWALLPLPSKCNSICLVLSSWTKIFLQIMFVNFILALTFSQKFPFILSYFCCHQNFKKLIVGVLLRMIKWVLGGRHSLLILLVTFHNNGVCLSVCVVGLQPWPVVSLPLRETSSLSWACMTLGCRYGGVRTLRSHTR